MLVAVIERVYNRALMMEQMPRLKTSTGRESYRLCGPCRTLPVFTPVSS